MDEFITRFTSLLRYVPYIMEEKAKVRRFVSSLPLYMWERIEFDNLKSMDKVIHKARICYQQGKQKGETTGRKWNEKRGFKAVESNKENRSREGKGNGKGQNKRSTRRTPSKFTTTSESRVSEQPARLVNEGAPRTPVQCWGCGGPHYVKNFPQRKGTEQLSQIQEASTDGEIGRSVPRINAALDNRQAEYQPTMVEFEGAKRRVTTKINDCSFTIAKQLVIADLNVLPLGSYDILIGMDWLEKHWSLVDCQTKIIYYRDQQGARKEMQGIKRPVQVRPITATQLEKCIRKGCQIYAIQVGYADSKDKISTLYSIPVI
eukprot:PITA_28227